MGAISCLSVLVIKQSQHVTHPLPGIPPVVWINVMAWHFQALIGFITMKKG